MANSKRKRANKTYTARPTTETAEVSHPTVTGHTQYVDRVTDTLTSMYNRRQLTQLQFAAGDRYRMSHEMTTASSGGAMDFDRARGSSGPSQGISLTYMIAADCCRDAKLKLYPNHFALVHRICVIGLTIEAAAKQLYDERYDGPWPPYLKNAGYNFRQALDKLAEMWWPDSRTKRDPKTGEEIRPMRSMRKERPVVTNAKAVPQASSVAHATRDKVYRGTQKRDRA